MYESILGIAHLSVVGCDENWAIEVGAAAATPIYPKLRAGVQAALDVVKTNPLRGFSGERSIVCPSDRAKIRYREFKRSWGIFSPKYKFKPDTRLRVG